MGNIKKAKIWEVGQRSIRSDQASTSKAMDMLSCVVDPILACEHSSQSISTQTWATQNRTAILEYNDMVVERGVFGDSVRSF